jgi:small subunit ribosomal protein S20
LRCDILKIRMANTVTALRRVRITERRTAINQTRKTRLRHGIRKMRKLLEAKDAKGAAEMVPKTFSLIDRAAKWGIIKKNTAARYKSRLTLRLRKLAAA